MTFVSCIVTVVNGQIAPQTDAPPITTVVPSYTCTTDALNASRKVCTDTSAAVYLKENFSIEIKNVENLDGTVCDWNMSVQQGSIFQRRFGIVCENKDKEYKILIGWVSSSMNNRMFLREFGSQHLSLNNLEDRGQDCIDHPALNMLKKEIKNLVAAGQCELSGQSLNKNLFSETFFFLPPGIKDLRFFIRIMDIGSATSQEKVDSFLMKMFKS